MDLKSRKRLLAWTVGVHDHANEETGKVERYGDNPDALISSSSCESCTYSHEPRQESEAVEKEPVMPNPNDKLEDKPEPEIQPVTNLNLDPETEITQPPVKEVSEIATNKNSSQPDEPTRQTRM